MAHNNGIIVGWDSVETGVDEFELQERHFDVVDQMAQPSKPIDLPAMNRLDDIASLVTRARRDVTTLDRIACQYNIDVNANDATSRIVNQTIRNVGHIVQDHARSSSRGRTPVA